MTENKKNLLVIGAPNVGKTHFGAQLYGRLKSNQNKFKLRETPDDITLFQDILRKLNNGIPGDHTPMTESRELILPIIDRNGNQIDLIYPDYGGEQITQIVKNRKINLKWQEQIELSTDWILILRPSLIESIEDITTRFYKHLEKGKASEETDFKGLQDNTPIFYIELLQMLLYAKKLTIHSTQKPFLLILLSCWDELNVKELKPDDFLKAKMPLFFDFIKSNWDFNFSVLGLASTGTTLSSNTPNKGFIIKGPENYGYIVGEDGNENTDLTAALAPLFKGNDQN